MFNTCRDDDGMLNTVGVFRRSIKWAGVLVAPPTVAPTPSVPVLSVRPVTSLGRSSCYRGKCSEPQLC